MVFGFGVLDADLARASGFAGVSACCDGPPVRITLGRLAGADCLTVAVVSPGCTLLNLCSLTTFSDVSDFNAGINGCVELLCESFNGGIALSVNGELYVFPGKPIVAC